jgi:hypothetical protein
MSNLAAMKIIALKFMRPIQMSKAECIPIFNRMYRCNITFIGTTQPSGIFKEGTPIVLN